MLSKEHQFYTDFWKLYAERHPITPHAKKFRNGYRFHTPSYSIKENQLIIKQYLGPSTVAVYVTGKPGESIEAAAERLSPHLEQINLLTNDYLSPDAPEKAVCANVYYVKGGTRDPDNWKKWLTFWKSIVKNTNRFCVRKSI